MDLLSLAQVLRRRARDANDAQVRNLLRAVLHSEAVPPPGEPVHSERPSAWPDFPDGGLGRSSVPIVMEALLRPTEIAVRKLERSG